MMATTIRKVNARKKITLEDDGIISENLQQIIHDAPSEVHMDRASEAVGCDRNNVPVMATVGELLAWILTVKASGGQLDAMKEVLDRFSPKASRAATNVDVNVSGAAAPVASKNSEEQTAATSYMDSLRAVK
jgi:hypothetical protein